MYHRAMAALEAIENMHPDTEGLVAEVSCYIRPDEPEKPEYDLDYASSPGETLIDCLEGQRTENERFAYAVEWMRGRTDISLGLLVGILDGSEPIDKALAHRLEEYTDIPYSFWLRREKAYREALKKEES